MRIHNHLLCKTTQTLCFVAMVSVLFTTGCKKDTQTQPFHYTVPDTYSFSNVNYSGQTTRLLMLDSIANYMSKSAGGTTLNAATLKNMYANTGSPFNNSDLDASGKALKNKTYSFDQAYFDGLFDSLANTSQFAGQAGFNGTPGIVTSTTNSSKKYLLDKNGLEYAQVIKKQLMGAVFYYQAVEKYLADLPTDDNSTVTTGEGTAMEHHCDEAFGYLGIPVDFPANVSGLKYWGGYADEVNTMIGCSTPIMTAFLKLRAAISNRDYTVRDTQIMEVRNWWEKIVAASAILELTEAKGSFSDDALRSHYLSEGIGFIRSMKYNSTKSISQAQIDAVEAALGSNFYTVSTNDIDNAIAIINGVYGFDLSKF